MEKLHNIIECPECNHQFANPIFDQDREERTKLEKELKALKEDNLSLQRNNELKINDALKKGEEKGYAKYQILLKEANDKQSQKEQEVLTLETKQQELEGQLTSIKQKLELQHQSELNKKLAEQQQLAMHKQTRHQQEILELQTKNQELSSAVSTNRHNTKLELQAEFDKKLNEARQLDLAKFDERVSERAKEALVAVNLQLEEERKDKERMRSQIEKLKHGSKNSSQEIQGEAGENFIEDSLRDMFPMDDISEVKKGQRGADIVHTVTNLSRAVGSILIESKNTNTFQPAWIEKIETDMHEKNITVGVIVTFTVPDNPFEYINRGIYIASFSNFKILVPVLRQSLIKRFNFERKEENKHEKAVRVYDFFKSEAFALQLRKLIQLHNAREDMLEKEKSYIQKIWAKRRSQLDWEISVAMGFIAEIQREALPGEFTLIDQEVAALEPDIEDELFQENE